MCIMLGGIYAGYVVSLGYISNSKDPILLSGDPYGCTDKRSPPAPSRKASRRPGIHQLSQQCVPDLHAIPVPR